MDIEKEKILSSDRIENNNKNEERKESDRENRVEKEEKRELDKEKEIREKLSKLKKNVSASPLSTRDEKREIERLSYPEKVGALVSLAFEKGIEEATAIAVSLDDPSLVDEFHDTLVDQYKERLLEKGIINGKKDNNIGNSLKGKGLIIFLILLIILSFIAFLTFLFS